MAKQIDFLPVAAAGGANVDSQAAFAGSGYQVNGYQNGIAQPSQQNKINRQTTMMAAALANFISARLNIDVLDDGNLANLITNLTAALRNANSSVLTIPYAPAPVFDASQSNKFETTLTGDMSPTLVNTTPGQRITIVVHQDAVGNHAFNPPANLPMDPVSGNANITNRQDFDVLANGTLFPATGMISQ